MELLVAVALGVLCTYVVAWALAAWGPLGVGPEASLDLIRRGVGLKVIDWYDTSVRPHVVDEMNPAPVEWVALLTRESTRARGCRGGEMGLVIDQYVWSMESRAGGAWAVLMRLRSGWPELALSASSAAMEQGGWPPTPEALWRGGIKPPGFVRAGAGAPGVAGMLNRALPLRPLWGGFAVDAGMYAIAAWVLVVAPRRVVRVLGRLAAAVGIAWRWWILWSVLSGFVVSVLAAIVGPVVLGGAATVDYDEQLHVRTRTWMTTTFELSIYGDAGTNADAVRKTRTGVFRNHFEIWGDYFSLPDVCTVFESGFPCRALFGWNVHVSRSHPSSRVEEAEGYFELPGGLPGWAVPKSMRGRVLPFLPMWWGMLINGAAWSVVSWGVIGVVLWPRRFWRVKEGRCGGCGYDTTGLPVGGKCPECGRVGTPV